MLAQVYQTMVMRGVRPSIATFGTLITAASDTGDVAVVKQVPMQHLDDRRSYSGWAQELTLSAWMPGLGVVGGKRDGDQHDVHECTCFGPNQAGKLA